MTDDSLTEDPLDGKPKSPVAAIIVGVILFLLGLAAWFAVVPVTFIAAMLNHTHDPVTRSLLMLFLLIFTLLAGSGTAMLASKLSAKHIAIRRTIIITFFAFLVIGLANFMWLGTLPNGFETPIDLGPSVNR